LLKINIERGSNIIVESPSYLGALQAFDLAGANVLSVEQECDGPNIGELELLFKRGDITFFYAVPDFHNPTGCCWSLAKRQKVAELCVEYNVLFIEDAPYRELRFLGEELPTVTSFCADHSIILYSYSKIIAPSIRVGAVIFPMRYLGDLYKLKQVMDLHTSVPMQEIVNQVLRDNSYATNLSRIRNLYYERYLALKNELVEIETIKDDFSEVQGGMFIWLKLNGVCARVLAKTALNYGVAIVPSDEFYTAYCQYKSTAIRLNFTHNEPQRLIEGVNRLKLALKSIL